FFGDAIDEVLQTITAPFPWFADLDDEDPVVGRHLRPLALDRSNLLGECFRNTQRQAIAPSQKFDLHNMLLQRRYNVDTDGSPCQAACRARTGSHFGSERSNQ